ncbi:MAG: proton-conducting transporter membrane subunit [Planctomycetaceae bacterium]|nr:proton-conducting transporter membrane subunit [Planctomycetaceae bacterium]
MTELHFPWLDALVLMPLIAAVLVGQLHDAFVARKWAIVASGITLLLAICAWQDFGIMDRSQADDAWHLSTMLFGRELFAMDRLSAPLLPLTALLYFLTALTTQRTKIRRFSFGLMLLSEGLVLGTFASLDPWMIIGLTIAGTVPPLLELLGRKRSVRVYLTYQSVFILCLFFGWMFAAAEGNVKVHTLWAIVPLLLAVLIRSGMAPVHGWLTDLFGNATLGTALLTAAPLPGMYLAVRLLLPIAPDWILQSMGLVSLFTAVYAAGMSLVQREARRFFCYLFLSHSAMVLVGLEMVTPIGVTGALCLWLSVGLSLGGLGLVIRAVEARCGRVHLDDYLGLYEHMPLVAVCFFLMAIGSVGFPGTLGFVGAELLIDGAVEAYPSIGAAVIVAATLNGIAIMRAYFLIFTGKRHSTTVNLNMLMRERIAILTLVVLILGGGIWPQPGVLLRHQAARELLERTGHPAALTTPAYSHAHGEGHQADPDAMPNRDAPPQ